MSDIPVSVQWFGFYATVAGLAVSVIGLAATFWQALQAKRAALEAKDAARNAIAALQQRNLFGTLSNAITNINMIREFINKSEMTAARASFYHCSRDVKDVFYNLKISSGPSGATDNIDMMIDEISVALDSNTLSTAKRAAATRSLRKISDMMSTDEAKRKWSQ